MLPSRPMAPMAIPPRHVSLPGVALLLLLLPPLGERAWAAVGEELTLVDRVIAVVDEDPILWSDLERAIALGLAPRRPGEDEATLHRRVLDELIDQRLRQHEIDRYDFEEVPVADVERHLESVRSRFASDAEYRATLARLGLDAARLRQLVARQLLSLAYLEERLGPRVLVGIEEIQVYYEEVLLPELAARGESAPALEGVRESIRAVLRERRLNEEIESWTRDLRRSADVIDLLERSEVALPTLVVPLPRDRP